jgi:hypothetical protein
VLTTVLVWPAPLSGVITVWPNAMGLTAPKATAAAKANGLTCTSKRLRDSHALRRAWRCATDEDRGLGTRVMFGFQ